MGRKVGTDIPTIIPCTRTAGAALRLRTGPLSPVCVSGAGDDRRAMAQNETDRQTRRYCILSVKPQGPPSASKAQCSSVRASTLSTQDRTRCRSATVFLRRQLTSCHKLTRTSLCPRRAFPRRARVSYSARARPRTFRPSGSSFSRRCSRRQGSRERSPTRCPG